MRQTGNKILDSLNGADEALHPLSTWTLKTDTTNCYETLVSIRSLYDIMSKQTKRVTLWITMNMEKVRFSGTSILLFESTPHHMSEDRHRQI